MLWEWLKVFHIVFVVAWMAGLFILVRYLAHHATASPGGELDQTLKVAERRVRLIILLPASVLSWVLGIWLAWEMLGGWDGIKTQYWLHAKFALVVLLTAYHHAAARWSKAFARGENRHTTKFFRIVNELPMLVLIGIVILAVIKPF